jgi:dienelactone hydrolase
MEKKIKLKTKDGYTIYGTLNTSSKSNILAVFVHGLTGHPNEHTFHGAAQQFPKKGVGVFRFALYTGEKGGRKLSECTISTHTEDLNKVLTYFRSKYKTIAVIGHSLGSPTILKSDISKVDSVILWDPSYLAKGSEDRPNKKVKVNGKEKYIEEWGTEYLMNPTMVREWGWFNGKNELDIVSSLNKPLKIIAAGNGILIKGSKEYFEVAQKPKDLTIIKGATHCFDEEGKEDILLSETLKWIKKYGTKR